jgi:hypothetical protein
MTFSDTQPTVIAPRSLGQECGPPVALDPGRTGPDLWLFFQAVSQVGQGGLSLKDVQTIGRRNRLRKFHDLRR